MNTGRTVRLFLVDGSPSGLITAEIINWTGHVLIASRQAIGEALKRDEASRTGIYFLIGEDPDQPLKRDRVYIGEGDIVSDRIRNHAKDSSKDFWTRACFVTSKDPNITKAHVRYLESRLVELTKVSGRASLANGNEPGAKSLPESDVADMEFFLEQIQLILPVVGFDFLRPKPSISLEPSLPIPSNPSSTPLELFIASKKYGLDAKAIEFGSEITVLAGSKALTEEFTSNSYSSLRQQLIDDGRLEPLDADSALLQFTEDVRFGSPSAASSVIFNRNTNGRMTWKVRNTCQTLKEWQDAQIPQPDITI
jgi:hypothetical protein